jgi:hypothetical protein
MKVHAIHYCFGITALMNKTNYIQMEFLMIKEIVREQKYYIKNIYTLLNLSLSTGRDRDISELVEQTVMNTFSNFYGNLATRYRTHV